jgi:DNA-binding HxlR family transcriptional regulator
MANKQQILQALEPTEQRLPFKPGELARQLGADENPKVLSVQLHRLAKEGFVEKKGIKSGWFITDLGKLRLSIYREQANRKKPQEEKEPAGRQSKWAKELDQEIETNISTEYGEFLKKGRGAARVCKLSSQLVLDTAKYIVLATDGNLKDLQRIKKALDQYVLPPRFKNMWYSSWCTFIMGPEYSKMLARQGNLMSP